MEDLEIQRMFRTHESSINGNYITEVINNPEYDSWDLVLCKLGIQDVDYDNNNGILELFLQNGDNLFPYVLSGVSEIKSFLDDMQVLRDPNAAWKDIVKLKGKNLYGFFHYDSEDFYALGIPTRKYKIGFVGKLENKIKENIKEVKEKKEVNGLSNEDYAFADALRKEGLVDKEYSITERVEHLAEDNAKMDDYFDNAF